MTLPAPTCTYGYTDAQLEAILGDRFEEFSKWIFHQTRCLCTGRDPCTEAHGSITYAYDVQRFFTMKKTGVEVWD